MNALTFSIKAASAVYWDYYSQGYSHEESTKMADNVFDITLYSLDPFLSSISCGDPGILDFLSSEMLVSYRKKKYPEDINHAIRKAIKKKNQTIKYVRNVQVVSEAIYEMNKTFGDLALILIETNQKLF